MIKDFEKEVTIINTCEFNSVANGAIVPPFVANVIKDYSKITSIGYLGHEIGFFQPDTGGFEDETILDFVLAINAFQPELILRVGCRNVLSELYSEKCFSFMYPTAATLPLTMKNYFHTWQKADEHSLRQAEDEGIREYYLFEKHSGFEAPRKSKMLSRNEMKIPESAFVFAVVGMRLQNVVDDAFLDMIEEVVDESAAHILFVGHFDSYEAVVGSRDRLTGRCTYAGFQNDIMSAYEICDAYINPKQPGGGSAIVYAMAAGLPALSLPYGDGGLAVEKLPEIVDYRALARVARTLCHDDALCDRYKTMTKEISMELSSRGPLVNKIMEAFSAYREGSLRSRVMVDR